MVAQKCSGAIVTIRKLNLPRETTKMLIQALVFPMIMYCLPVWAPKFKTLRNRIEKVINFAVRTVTGLRKFDHVSRARAELGWLTFDAMIGLRDVQRIHHIMWHRDASQQLRALLETRSQVSLRLTRSTADETMLHFPKCCLQSTKLSFPHRAVATWNRLPQDMRVSRAAAFKRKMCKFLAVV